MTASLSGGFQMNTGIAAQAGTCPPDDPFDVVVLTTAVLP